MRMLLTSLLTDEDGQASIEFCATMGGFFLIALSFLYLGASLLSSAFLGQAPMQVPAGLTEAGQKLMALVPHR